MDSLHGILSADPPHHNLKSEAAASRGVQDDVELNCAVSHQDHPETPSTMAPTERGLMGNSVFPQGVIGKMCTRP